MLKTIEFIVSDDTQLKPFIPDDTVNPFRIRCFHEPIYVPFKPPTRNCDINTRPKYTTRQKARPTQEKPRLSTSFERRLDYITACAEIIVQNDTPVYDRQSFSLEERANIWANIDKFYKAQEK